MTHQSVLRAAARCWERAGQFDRAAERYARADAWIDAGRCWAQAGRPVDAAAAYARAGEPINEARQWLASPWPERARRPYRQVLELGLSTAAEVEARLGLGEIELASERAFTVAPENGRSVEALRSFARLAAARGRPDLAARAWNQAIAWCPAATREVFENWELSASWNRSLRWGWSPGSARNWPSRAFRDVRLELVWETRISNSAYGNCALAWSSNSSRFAATTWAELILGDSTGREARHQSLRAKTSSVAFIPGSDSVLVGCTDGRVVRVDPFGVGQEVEALQTSDVVWAVAFSPKGDHVAISSFTKPGSVLRVWSWDFQAPRAMLQESKTKEGTTNPFCAWSPDGRTLAWCPGLWSEGTVPNGLYLFSDAGTRHIPVAHENNVDGIAFTPDGRHLATVSADRILTLRDAHTGEAVAPPWNCAQRLKTVAFHPHAALIAVGGTEDIYDGYTRPSRYYLFRISKAGAFHLEVIQENTTETAVYSLAFSPDGEHLLMSTNDRLSLFRVHLL